MVARRSQPAEAAAMPQRIEPMLATLVDDLPRGDQFIYEQKWDGYRTIAFLERGAVRLISRNHNDLTRLFPEVVQAILRLGHHDAILDGEIIALDPTGQASFQLLQNRTGIHSSGKRTTDPTPVVYVAFDLLFRDGDDLRPQRLDARRSALERLLAGKIAGSLHYSDSVRGRAAGELLLAEVRKAGMEGVVAKDVASPYVARRSNRWQKIKVARTQDCIIAGVTRLAGPDPFGTLILAVCDGEQLHYVCHTGGGLKSDVKERIFERLRPITTKKRPLVGRISPNVSDPIQWVQPRVVVEVRYTEWTDDGKLRHPSFQGLRLDKRADECTREQPTGKTREATVRYQSPLRAAAVPVDEAMKGELHGDMVVRAGPNEVRLTNLDKVYWPDEGYTKGDLLRYYYRVADFIVPHLRDRPLVLHRFPNGITGESFYRHRVDDVPPYVPTVLMESSEGPLRYAMIDCLASLLYVVNLGTIAQHPLHAREGNLTRPDWILFDLDPEGVAFDTCCKVAVTLNGYLKKIGLQAYAKTSGGDGIHVMVPLRASYSYDQVQDFALLVAGLVAADHSDIVTLTRMRAKRGEKHLYLDCLQNQQHKSIAAVYSAREKPGATVSAPLTWPELARGVRREDFTMITMPERVRRRGDLREFKLKAQQVLYHRILHVACDSPTLCGGEG